MGGDWSAMVKPAAPGAPTGPRPRQQAAAAPRPAYPYQQQQPVAAVPYPVGYPTQQQQQQVQPVTTVPWPAQQQQQQQPTDAVPKPQQQQQQQQQTSYPAYQTYQPYPVAAVGKPDQAFVPVVGSTGAASARTLPAAQVTSSQQQATPSKLTGSNPASANFRTQQATPHSAPALPASAPSSERPVIAAVTKPFSAPAFLSPLSAAVPKPDAPRAAPQAATQPTTTQISSRGRLPRNAPVQTSDTEAPATQGQIVAAVGKAPFPVDTPRSHWPHIGHPVSSSGAMFSVSAPMQPIAAAVLSPELQQALDRHNQYRYSTYVSVGSCADILCTAQLVAAFCISFSYLSSTLS
jgi:hypothetical protein